MTMPAVPESVIRWTARAGSFLALALALWYACAALHWPFVVFLAAFIVVVVVCSRSSSVRGAADTFPLVPVLIVLAIVLSPLALMLHGASGPEPHWFSSSDDAFTILTARGLAGGIPPRDLSWDGQPLRYHLGTALLVDLLHRATRLPLHTVHYALAPLLLRLIILAALLLLVRRIAPELPRRWQVWMPLAAGALPTIDLFQVAWHAHDLWVRGRGALSSLSAASVFPLDRGLLSTLVIDSSSLAIAFTIVLIATWRETTVIEKAALLFAVFLSKAQVFLAVGAGYGVIALSELVRRRWRPFAAGALALACVVPALGNGSTYGSLARMTVGCGALCRQLLRRHNLEGRFPDALVIAVEIAVLFCGLHLVAAALVLGVRRIRKSATPELALGISMAVAGFLIAMVLSLAPSAGLQERFLAVHRGVSDRLFMPLPVYLQRILDVSTAATFHTTLLVPIFGVPLLAVWMSATRRAAVRRILSVSLVVLLAFGAFQASAPGLREIDGKDVEVPPDTLYVLRSIPPGARAVITNDLGWDDTKERHLPLLNIRAPAVSGRQFWASAFMFTFQHPDAAERLRRIEWFFAPATGSDARIAFARAAGIDHVLLRTDLAVRPLSFPGWTRVAARGRYELYRLGSP